MYAFVSRILSTIPLIPVQLLLIKKLNTDVSLLEVFSINSWRSKWPVLRKCWVLVCCFVLFFFFSVFHIFFSAVWVQITPKSCVWSVWRLPNHDAALGSGQVLSYVGSWKTLEWSTSASWLRALGFLLRDIKKPPIISKQIERHFLGPLKSKHSERGFVMFVTFVASRYQYAQLGELHFKTGEFSPSWGV